VEGWGRKLFAVVRPYCILGLFAYWGWKIMVDGWGQTLGGVILGGFVFVCGSFLIIEVTIRALQALRGKYEWKNISKDP